MKSTLLSLTATAAILGATSSLSAATLISDDFESTNYTVGSTVVGQNPGDGNAANWSATNPAINPNFVTTAAGFGGSGNALNIHFSDADYTNLTDASNWFLSRAFTSLCSGVAWPGSKRLRLQRIDGAYPILGSLCL